MSEADIFILYDENDKHILDKVNQLSDELVEREIISNLYVNFEDDDDLVLTVQMCKGIVPIISHGFNDYLSLKRSQIILKLIKENEKMVIPIYIGKVVQSQTQHEENLKHLLSGSNTHPTLNYDNEGNLDSIVGTLVNLIQNLPSESYNNTSPLPASTTAQYTIQPQTIQKHISFEGDKDSFINSLTKWFKMELCNSTYGILEENASVYSKYLVDRNITTISRLASLLSQSSINYQILVTNYNISEIDAEAIYKYFMSKNMIDPQQNTTHQPSKDLQKKSSLLKKLKNSKLSPKEKVENYQKICKLNENKINNLESMVNEMKTFMISESKSKHGSTPLMMAVEKGLHDLVLEYIQKGADIHVYNKFGINAIMIASSMGHVEIMQLLLHNGAYVNSVDQKGRNCFMKAVEHCHATAANVLKKNGADIHSFDKKGYTAFTIASESGHLDILKLLMNLGASAQLEDKRGMTPLLCACVKGHDQCVTFLLKNGYSVHSQKQNGWTALMIAAHHGHATLVQLLLNHGAVVNAFNKDGLTSLMLSAQRGHINVIQLLLTHKAHLNFQDKSGNTALMYATKSGHTACTAVLLRHGADVHIRNQINRSALILAAENGKTEIVQQLLDAQANPNDSLPQDGISCIMLAASNGHSNTTRLLANYGANLQMTLQNGITPLMVAVSEGSLATVRFLIDAGAVILKSSLNDEENKILGTEGVHHINYQTEDGWNALMVATAFGHDEIVALLIDRGADIHAVSKEKKTALMIAFTVITSDDKNFSPSKMDTLRGLSKSGLSTSLLKSSTAFTQAFHNIPDQVSKKRNAVLQVLLNKGVNPNAVDQDGRSALVYAIFSDDDLAVTLLIGRGAKLNTPDTAGLTPLMHAVQGSIKSHLRLDHLDDSNAFSTLHSITVSHQQSILKTTSHSVQLRSLPLQQSQASPLRSLHRVHFQTNNQIVIIHLLIDNGALVNAQNKDGWTVLMFASRAGDSEIVSLLLDRGAIVDAQDKAGNTSLMRASSNGHDNVVKVLLTNKAQIDAQNEDGRTGLMAAAANGKTETVRKLLDHGANIDVVNKLQSNVLMFAVVNGHTDTAKLLIDRGADCKFKNQEGWSILLLSAQKGLQLLVKLLIEKGCAVNDTNVHGSTALMKACAYGHKDIIRYLLDHHADVEVVDNEGWNVLHYAAYNNKIDAVIILLNQKLVKALSVLPNKEGKIPRGVTSNEEIQKLLVEAEIAYETDVAIQKNIVGSNPVIRHEEKKRDESQPVRSIPRVTSSSSRRATPNNKFSFR